MYAIVHLLLIFLAGDDARMGLAHARLVRLALVIFIISMAGVAVALPRSVKADSSSPLDGIGQGPCNSTAPVINCSTQLLTTTQSNDVVIIVAEGTNSTTVSDSSGLSFVQRVSYSSTTYPPLTMVEFYAVAAFPLKNDNITVSDAPRYTNGMQAFAIHGADTASLFDQDPSIPATVSCPGPDCGNCYADYNTNPGTCSASIQTSASDFVVATTAINDALPCGGYPTSPAGYVPPPGFTHILASDTFEVDYTLSTSPPNSVKFDCNATDASAIVLDAVNIPTAAPYALVVTAEGNVYRFYQNGTLTLVGQPVTTPLRQVAWKPDGSYALIVGDFATLVKYDGTSLTTVPTGISTGFNFWSVSWKQDGSYALIGGSVGLLLKYDGVSVTQISNPGGTTILSMSWHPSGTYVVLSGKSGGLRTYDGSTIKSFATGTTNDLNTAAWNPNGQYALIGGLNGAVLKFDGTTVTSISTNGLTGTNAIKSIAFNPLGTLALHVGDNGMVLTYNGSTLTLVTQVTYSWLRAVNWSTSGTAYILGGSGTVLTYANGTEAKLTTSPVTTSQFRGIAWKPQ